MGHDDCRRAVLEACRTLVDRGFLAGTGGNVALRVDDELFAVTPSATDYLAMSPEDICVLRLRDLGRVAGDRTPSVESGLHARLLLSRPGCQASVHTHQPLASAFTLLSRPLPVTDRAHRELLGNEIPCSGYAPSGTRWLAWKVARALRPGVHTCLMRNHGAVVLAATTDLAFRRVEALEEACAAYFHERISKRRSALPPPVASGVLETLMSRRPPL